MTNHWISPSSFSCMFVCMYCCGALLEKEAKSHGGGGPIGDERQSTRGRVRKIQLPPSIPISHPLPHTGAEQSSRAASTSCSACLVRKIPAEMGGIRRGESPGTDHRHNAPLHLTGIGSLRKQGGEHGILPDPLFGGNRLCTPKRAGRTPMKMLIDDEVCRDVTVTHTSPGIVGRLMGLDMMPSFGAHIQNICYGNRSQDMSPGSCSDKSGSCCDRYAFSGEVPYRRSTDEIPEFKDVFEVMEATRMNNRNHTTCSGLEKVNSADINFIRQKFMAAKHLSTDESFQRSEEFRNALEALVSNKDLMEILQESNNAVTTDLSDLGCSPSSGVNHITLLKPSRTNKFIDADVVYPPEEDTESCFHAPKESKHSPSKPYISSSSQLPKEDNGSIREKLSRSSSRERNDKRISPTRIVVLKPCLEKTQNMEGAFPLTHEMFSSSYRRIKACLDDGIQRPYAEGSMPQMSRGYSDVLGHSGKGSREIAREVQTRRAVKGGVRGKQILHPDIGTFNWDEQVSSLSSMAKLKSSEAFRRSSGLFDASDAPCFGSPPTYSTKTSIRKEARRRLSDRWKMTQQYQHQSQGPTVFSTLGDMLALSDKETPKSTSVAAACQKCPNGELHRNGMPGSCGYPLGISSNDGWKDENSSNLTRSKSISSSINGGSPKLSSRNASCRHSEYSMLRDITRAGSYNSEKLYHGRPRRSLIRSSIYHYDESDVPSLDEAESAVTEREIHVNFEEPTYDAAVPELSETGGRLAHAGNSNHSLDAEHCLDTSSVVPELQDEAHSSRQYKVMDREQTSTLDDSLIAPSLNDSASQAEGNGHDQCEDSQATSDPLTELVSSMSSNEDDQPSPVSVLESSMDAEDCCSRGFEKISADLQELRMQLRLLKMEATDSADGTKLGFLSDDETAASCELNEIGPTSCTFWDEDERDFSYVVDMLTCLGIQSAEQDRLLDAHHLWGFPWCSDVYGNLEKKYSKLILWPRSERRLLFDLTNDVLVEMVTCLTHHGFQGLVKKFQLSLKWDKEGLVEEVWERVCRQRREAECFQEEKLMSVGWLDCEDVTDEIAGEMGSMLEEDLLEEVIADFLL